MPDSTLANMDSRGAGLIRPSLPVTQRTDERDVTRSGGDKSKSSSKAAHSDQRATGRRLGSRLVRRRSFDDATNPAATREIRSSVSIEKADTASDQAATWIPLKSRASVPLRARANSGPPLDCHKRGSCLYQTSRSTATKPTRGLVGYEDRQFTLASNLGPKAAGMDGGDVARGVPSAKVQDVREWETMGYKPGAGSGDNLKGEVSLLRPLAGRCWFQGCGKVTVYRCRRCREAFYCSKDHQRRHWGKHRSKCKEGVGEPTPTLAYRTLPISSSVPPLRQQAKAVGWADSASYSRSRTAADVTCQSADGGRVPPGVGGVWLAERQPLWHPAAPATPAVAATGAILPPGTNQESLGQSSSSGNVDANAIPRAVDGISTNLKDNRDPSTALRDEGSHGFDSSVRTTRGGTTWAVLSSGRGAGGGGGGSAEVWPSSTGGSIGGSGRNITVGNIADEAAAVARRRVSGASFGRAMGSRSANGGLGGGKQRGASTSPPRHSPSPIPPSCLPPNLEPLIPLPSGRPFEDGTEVTSTPSFDDGLKMLTDMGFEHDKARRALRLCDKDVERAAEFLLAPDDDLAVCGVGIGIPDGGDTSGGGEVVYGPHRKPPDDDDGKLGWGGGTELEVVSTNETGGKHSGKRDDDDLITNADPGDVAQGLDLGDFWEADKVSEGGGASSGTALAAQCTIASHAAGDWKRSVDFGKRDHEQEGRAKVEDEDNRDLVTSYEDCIAGANADVLIYYQSSDDTRLSTITTTTATTATGTAASATPDPDMGTAAIQAQTSVVTERSEATDLDILPLAFAQPASLEVPLDTTAEVPTVTATTVVSNCLSEGDAVSAGGEAVLTIILRPLPSTAPASLDSDSCTGEGTDDRYDPPHDTEHLSVFLWRDAEALAWRYQQTKAKTAIVKATTSESSMPGGATNARGGRLFIDPSALPLPQSPTPLSPLSPPACARPLSTPGEQSTACSSIDGAVDGASPPTWRRKYKVGRMIANMFRRSIDGGFEIVAPEDMETLDGIGRKANPVAHTRERPRGRSSAKLARYGAHACGDRLPLHEQPAPPSSFKWGADVKELIQAWSCPACTFLNTDPAFRTACEICRKERPHTPLLSSDDPTGWGLRSRDPGGVELQVGATVEGVDDTGGTTSNAFFPASDVGGDARAPDAVTKGSTLLEPVAVGGVHGSSAASHNRGADQQDEDDDVVDGILGGVSPGGIASPPAPEPTLNESEWEAGTDWGGFGGASFVESPVDFSPLRSRFNLRYQDVTPNQADENGAEDNQCASTGGGGNARPP